jgi:hypothetical protein
MLPEEMLALLDDWTVRKSVSAIAITFEGTTIFAFHDDRDRLATLQNALSLGGLAVGMFVLAQPEMEKRRFPLVKIPPLRGGDFQGMESFVPMLYWG